MINTNHFGQWLDSYRWSSFTTLTTRYELTPKSARRLVTLWFNRLCVQSALNGEKNCAMAYFFERNNQRNGVHIHLLLRAQCSKQLQYKVWQEVTNGTRKPTADKTNYVRSLDYIPEFGAAFYVCKYVSKNAVEWDFSYKGDLSSLGDDLLRSNKNPFAGWKRISSSLTTKIEEIEGQTLKQKARLLPMGNVRGR